MKPTIKTRCLRQIFLILLIALAGPQILAQQSAPLVDGVDAIGVTVSDMDRAVDFYSEFSLSKRSQTRGRERRLRTSDRGFWTARPCRQNAPGDESIELTEYLAPKGRPIPVDSRSNDAGSAHAIIVSDMDKAYRFLRQNKSSTHLQGRNAFRTGTEMRLASRLFTSRIRTDIPSRYCNFRPIRARRNASADRQAVLGHRPYGNRSLGHGRQPQVYRDLLGLRVAGESENYGTEQEHLNNVFGAHLRITALRGAKGPGIELLEYLAPRDGRPFPADERSNDIVHRQTLLLTHDAQATARQAHETMVNFVSSGVVANQTGQLGFTKVFVVRDPDGHAVEIEER